MRYQKEIVERLRQGLAAADKEAAALLVEQFQEPRKTLKDFADEVNVFYGTLASGQVKPDVEKIGYPENTDAIPFWIEDLESVVLPAITMQRLLK